MPKIKYQDFNFRPATLRMIEYVNAIVARYRREYNLDLTLRQVYYQCVAKGIIPNNQKEYDKLGTVINNGRLAGLIDWDAIVDRTRNVEKDPAWEDPAQIIAACGTQFKVDLWANQPHRVEVWIEKDALKGVIAGVWRENNVPYFSCRGYTSQSEMWSGAQRLLRHVWGGQKPLILHLGDHDPSGKDMTRDIIDRMQLFMGGIPVERLALNWDQIEQYNPPENPAKLTDSRATAYIEEFGSSSFELDALDPPVIIDLIQTAIDKVKDPDLWDELVSVQDKHRSDLMKVSDNWDNMVENYLDNV